MSRGMCRSDKHYGDETLVANVEGDEAASSAFFQQIRMSQVPQTKVVSISESLDVANCTPFNVKKLNL